VTTDITLHLVDVDQSVGGFVKNNRGFRSALWGLTLLTMSVASIVNGARHPAFDLIIRNARVIDGTGHQAFWADIAVREGRIVKVGVVPGDTRSQVIDAHGAVAAPGFIDIHTHVESIYRSPTAENFIRMGVTSVITGNCGSSSLDVGAFLNSSYAQPLTVNLGTFIGHNSVRYYVMQNENRAPSPDELLRMEKIVERGMEDGALGFSTGLVYVPGAYSKTSEIVALSAVAARYGGVYATHMRDEGDGVFKALDEAIEISKQANIPMEISHFKITSKRLWGQSGSMLAIIRDARKEGVRINIDEYAYTASSTSLDVLLPDWVRTGSRESTIMRLGDPAIRAQVAQEMKTTLSRSGYQDYSHAVVANYPRNRSLEGRSIAEITNQLGGQETVQAQIEQILTMFSRGGAGMIYHKMSEDDVREIMREPFTIIASDSGVRGSDEEFAGLSHPRSFGNNARVLGHYVRDLHLLTLEDAVKKMTVLPANAVGLTDRGVIRQGLAADIVIFDDATINDEASFEDPAEYPQGINWVIVNGKIVLANGLISAERPGVPLRRRVSRSGLWRQLAGAVAVLTNFGFNPIGTLKGVG
jgi:N-acyl-D-amino-acid deacylase